MAQFSDSSFPAGNDKLYKHIFIDLDDTIWDFHANARSSLLEIYASRQLNRFFDSFEQYFGIYSKRNTELWEMYGRGEVTKDYLSRERFLYPLQQVGVEDEDMAMNIGKEYLDMLPTRTALVPHAKELLDYLSGKYVLTIVSNGFVEVQYRKMKSAGLEPYFTHVVLSEQAKALKPDKQIFEYALRLNDAALHEAIMIGDSLAADITGAKNTGIDYIWFNPDHKSPDQDVMASVSSLHSIIDLL